MTDQTTPELVVPHIEETNNGVIVFIDEVITDEVLNPVIQCIVSLNINRPELEHITLFIDSPGGDVKSAMKLIDLMELSRIPVRTIGWGSVSSAALLIFMCGKQRLLAPNSQVLTHQATLNVGGMSAKIVDFESQQKEFRNICDRIVKIYNKHTGMSEKEINNKVMRHHDVWLNAEQAIAFGMGDDTLDNYRDVFWELIAGHPDPIDGEELEELEEVA